MKRRTFVATTGSVLSVSLVGCLSELPAEIGADGTESDRSDWNESRTAPDEGATMAIGSWQLTIFHESNRSPDDVEDAVSSDHTALADHRLQDLFDETIETGRATYSTHEEDEADALQTAVGTVPADENWYRYVAHEGELLKMRSMYLE